MIYYLLTTYLERYLTENGYVLGDKYILNSFLHWCIGKGYITLDNLFTV